MCLFFGIRFNLGDIVVENSGPISVRAFNFIKSVNQTAQIQNAFIRRPPQFRRYLFVLPALRIVPLISSVLHFSVSASQLTKFSLFSIPQLETADNSSMLN